MSTQKGAEVTPVGTDGDSLVDDLNDAVRVNVVAGGAGGGLSQLQVRTTDDTNWVNVGWATTTGGPLPVPVTLVGGTAAGGSTSVDANVTNATLAVTKSGVWVVSTSSSNPVRIDPVGTTPQPASQSGAWILSTSTAQIGRVILDTGSTATVTVSTLPALILSTSTANIGDVDVLTLPAIILSTSTAQIGRVIMDTGSTATVAVSTLPALILSTSTAQIGNVAVTSLPTLVLSTSTAQIGHVIVDSGSTINAAVTQSGVWVVSTSSTIPVRVDPVGTTAQPVSESGTWIISTSSANPARVDPTGTTAQPASQSGLWIVSTSSANPAYVRINDNGNIANATNVAVAGLVNNVLLTERSGRWSVTSAPTAGNQATASKSSGGATVKHIADSVIFCSVSTAAVAAATKLTFNLRDGAAGAGTVLATWICTMATTAAAQTFIFASNNLGLVGSANTAMTFECSTTLAASTQTVTLIGYDVS